MRLLSLLVPFLEKNSYDLIEKDCSFQGAQKDNSFLKLSWSEIGNTVSAVFKEESWLRAF